MSEKTLTPEQEARLDLARRRRESCEPMAFESAYAILTMLAHDCYPRLTDPMWTPLQPERVQAVVSGVLHLLEIANGHWRAQ